MACTPRQERILTVVYDEVLKVLEQLSAAA